ncbi:MAG: DUF6702 family protein [Bacteroidota bacterium]
MKQLLFVAIFLFSAFSAGAHEYFFAFAEVAYNADKGVFEITIEASAHDTEDVLNESGIAIKELEDHYTDSVMLGKIEGFINQGFALTTSGITGKLKLEGMEVLPNGLVFFYLSSAPIVLGESVDVQFDLLMDVMPQQQNKITLEVRQQKYTAVFVENKRKSTIKFDVK